MTTKDWIFAQNWVEQFRRNRRDFIGSEDYLNYPRMQESPYLSDFSVAISRAFTWRLTPEGSVVWDDRQQNFEEKAHLIR